MKILHICTTDGGGAGLCCIRIHDALIDCGIDSHVLVQLKSGKRKDVTSYFPLSVVLRMGIDFLSRKFGLYLSDQNKIIKLTKEIGGDYNLPTSYCDLTSHPLVREADVINIHWYCRFVDLPSFLAKVDKPVIFTLHDEYMFHGIAHYSNDVVTNNPLEHKCYEIKRQALLSNKKVGFVFLSQYMYNKFGSHEFVQGHPSVVINNAVNPDDFKIFNRQQMKNKLNLDENLYVIAFMSVCIDDPRKGLRDLINAVEDIGNPRIKILAIGGGGEGVESSYLVKVGALSGPSKISQVLSAANVFAMPSYQEAFAQTPIEAMACGLPTIVYPCSGTDELAEKCECLRCDNFSVKELKEAILISMNNECNPEQVREKVVENFSPHSIANRYIDFYNRMIDLKS